MGWGMSATSPRRRTRMTAQLGAGVLLALLTLGATAPLDDGARVSASRVTAVSVSCEPATVPVNAPTTCDAVVTDADAGSAIVPTGTVSFSADGGAEFATCALAGDGSFARCAVAFVPDAVGPHTVSAAYGGDADHASSNGSAALSAAPRSTSTGVGCEPLSVPVNATATCTAVVSDTSAGTAGTPTGTVTWQSSSWGRFGASTDGFSAGPPPTCVLSVSAGSASCSVTYTPTAAGLYAISAAYSGDATHSGSSGKTVSGGGQVNGTGRANFGFIAQQKTSGSGTAVSGQIDYFNHDNGLHIRGTVNAFAIDGNTATFSGSCTFRTPGSDAASCTFSVDVTDNGEPGGGSDAFTISSPSPPSPEANGGTILRGNIQVGARP
jgi:hypothetical protein